MTAEAAAILRTEPVSLMSVVSRLPSGDVAAWANCEEELAERGVSIPLEYRASWLREVAKEPFRVVVARDRPGGRILAAYPVEEGLVRALPGHRRLRISRFGAGGDRAGLEKTVDEVVSWIRDDVSLVGLRVDVFAADEEERRWAEALLAGRGLRPAASPRRYRWTARLVLDRSEEELLRSFTGTCRRFIRDPEKKGFRVERIADPRWADRMSLLWRETFSRTGTAPPPRDWADHLRFARRHPDLYRVVGTFSPAWPDEDSLVAFACGRHNGDHVQYADGASTRDVESGVALAYAPMWELIRWARSCGCAWFDLGGLPTPTPGADDRLAGISEFKRRFTRDVIDVGGAWEWKPRTLRGWLSDVLSASAGVLRGFRFRPG